MAETQYIYLVSRIETDVRLFSPQTYHQMHGGYSEVHSDCIRMLLKTSKIEIRIMREEHNLPIVFDSFVSGKAKKALASNMRSGLCHTRLNALDFFHDNDLGNLGRSPRNSVLDSEHLSNFCGACVGALRMKIFLLHRRTSQMALEVRHWDVSHSRDDVRMTLRRSRWKNDYYSSNNSAKEFFS